MIGILGGRDFLHGCSDLLSALTPHLLLFFTAAGLEKRRAKRTAKLRDSDLLPNDIISTILARLPVESLCRSRTVSKTYLNITDDPSFDIMYVSRSLNFATPLPQLTLVTNTKNYPTSVSTLRPLKYDGKQRLVTSGPCSNTKIVSRKGRYEVRSVFCNLFLFEKSGELFLVNPLRGEALKLPMNHYMVPSDRYWPRTKRFGMGFDHVTNTHKIVCIVSYPESVVEAYLYTLGGTAWRAIPTVPQYTLWSEQIVSAYGDMHCLIDHHQHRIMSFDFKNEEFVFTPQPKLEKDVVYSMHLLRYRGCLALVSRQYPNFEIWVLKDYETKEWELECKIEIKMFDRVTIYPLFHTCSEWEQGIIFTTNDEREWIFPFALHFWDARYNSLEYVDPGSLFPSVFSVGILRPELSIFSYTRSLISLKNYGNLVERKVFRSVVLEASETITLEFN